MFPHLTLLLDITSNNMKYSIIVPVFNRPEEVDELLESLLSQEEKDFEIIIVEDGSTIPCEEICKKYSKQLDIHYFFKSNSGPGQSRNYGAKYAKGKYLLILDSDIIIPKNYLSEINKELDKSPDPCFWKKPTTFARIKYSYREIYIFSKSHIGKTAQFFIYIATNTHIKRARIKLV